MLAPDGIGDPMVNAANRVLNRKLEPERPSHKAVSRLPVLRQLLLRFYACRRVALSPRRSSSGAKAVAPAVSDALGSSR
jgi:hypothetical protein